jgi:hypothetical protein
MEADFSGYATKAGLKCSDGRTIMPDAFKHQDKLKVPLVWQHGHTDSDNVLGHAILEARPDGVYAYAYFNATPKAQNAKLMVEHKDVEALSIYAGQLVEKAKQVFHGMIKEVSLVLSGANPGALIDFVNIAHADGEIETLDDEAVIFTGLALEHEDKPVDESVDEPVEEVVEHAGKTLQDVYDTMDDDQKEAVAIMVASAIESANTLVTHSDTAVEDKVEETTDTKVDDKVEEPADAKVEEVVDTKVEEPVEENVEVVEHDALSAANKALLDASKTGGPFPSKEMLDASRSMIAACKIITDAKPNSAMTIASKDMQAAKTSKALLEAAKVVMGANSVAAHSDDTPDDPTHQEGTEMTRNVFETAGGTTDPARPTLTHAQVKAIVEDAQRTGSFKESFLAHAVEYGIENIDFLFPDAQAVTSVPDVIGRRVEWVASVIGRAKHSPFSRIKSTAVDLTADEARAKGYVKANLKKDEIIKLLKRVTTPTTIYKKQKLDRDDIVDLTDLDIVAWLKAEMRIMLDEELGRAVLIGDGREPDDEDKIDEEHIRPIAFDDEMYAHQVTVPSNIEGDAIIEAVLRSRTYYKGTGVPTLYTTDAILTDLILLKDKVGRRLYMTEAELAAGMRVKEIVVVEVMESVPDLLAIIVNITDYTIGADKGGAISMFDDFDIDYNQYKYLIETRASGTLTKPKSAVVIKRVSGTLATPVAPTYNPATHTITIPTTAGVNYQIDDVTKSAGPVVITETTEVVAVPAATYNFAHNTDTDWTFPYTP